MSQTSADLRLSSNNGPLHSNHASADENSSIDLLIKQDQQDVGSATLATIVPLIGQKETPNTMGSYSNRVANYTEIKQKDGRNEDKGPYSKKYLQEGSSSKQYLKSVSYSLYFRDLMRVRSCVSYTPSIKNMPVLVEIVSDDLKAVYGGNFLFQVWSDQGKLMHEKVLKYEIWSMNCTGQLTLYRPDPREYDKSLIIILIPNETLKTVKEVQVIDIDDDNKYPYIGIMQNRLYFGNQNTIKMIKLPQDFMESEQKAPFQSDKESVRTTQIPLTMKLHGFFLNRSVISQNCLICLVELEDNQISFQRLYNWDDKQSFELIAYRDPFPRDTEVKDDPIQKFSFFINENDYLLGVAIRKSGFVDLYYNYQLSISSQQTYQDVSIDMTHVYLKEKLADGSSFVKKIKNKNEHDRFGFDISVPVGPFSEKKWNIIPLSMAKNHINHIKAIMIFNSSVIVAHSYIVSIFNLKTNKFTQCIKTRDKEIYTLVKSNIQYYILYVDGNNSELYVKDNHKQNEDEDPIQEFAISEASDEFKGKDSKIINLVTRSSERESRIFMLMHFKESNEYKIVSLISMYYHYDDEFPILEQDIMINYENRLTEYQSNNFMIMNQDTWEIKIVDYPIKICQRMTIKNEYSRNIQYALKTYQFGDNIILLFSHDTVFTLDAVGQRIIKKLSMTYASIMVMDMQYMYSITNEGPETESGFYIQSIHNFFDSKTGALDLQKRFKLKKTVGGKSKILQYFESEDRIALQLDFQTIKIFPSLHKNSVSILGMQELQKYLAFRRFDDLIVGLDEYERLYTWNITTGKLVSTTKLKQKLGLEGFKEFSQSSLYHKTSALMLSIQDIPDSLQFSILQKQSQIQGSDSWKKEMFGKYYAKGINEGRNVLDCETIYPMEMKVVKILNTKEIEILMEFEHYYFQLEGSKYQKIYISDDLNTMLEKRKNYNIFIFKREDSPDYMTTKKVKWVPIKRITNHATEISEFSDFNYLYSPNLQLYFDCDNAGDCFLIRNTIDQSIMLRLPEGLITPKKENSKEITKKFRWISNNRFKIINSDDLEKIFEITKDGNITVNGYGRVPMLSNKNLREKDRIHYYVDYSSLRNGITCQVEKFARKIQLYNSAYNVYNYRDQTQLYNALVTIDSIQSGFIDKIQIEMSFSFFHWKMAESLGDPEDPFKIQNLSPDEIKLLALNIFPQGRTLCHYIFKEILQINELYSVAQKSDVLYEPITIPFIRDFKGRSPMHLCLQQNNFQAISTFLQCIKDDPLDNHGRSFVDILPKILEAEIPSLGEYFTSRQMSAQHLKRIKRGKLKLLNWAQRTVVTSEQWEDEVRIKQKVLKYENILEIENDIVVKIIDIPQIHCFQEENGEIFFNTLSKINTLSFFENDVIKSIIDYKWPLAKQYTVRYLFIPFLIYLGLFIGFSNVLSGQLEESQKQKVARIVLIILLYIFSSYFLIHEALQIKKQGRAYLRTIWNIFDIVAPVLVIVVISIQLKRYQDTEYEPNNFVITVHSFACLMIWTKFLYFLRIFRRTGYLIRMLSTVIYDMKVFIFVLVIVYLGFGEAFLRLSENNQEDESQYIPNYALAVVYSFRLSIGDTDTDTFNDGVQPVTSWILFVLCATLTNIIMLNLLIAIISESFEKINSNSTNASYQERARLISENSYLIPMSQKIEYCPKDRYLLVAEEFNANEAQSNEDKEEDLLEEDRAAKLAKKKKEEEEKAQKEAQKQAIREESLDQNSVNNGISQEEFYYLRDTVVQQGQAINQIIEICLQSKATDEHRFNQLETFMSTSNQYISDVTLQLNALLDQKDDKKGEVRKTVDKEKEIPKDKAEQQKTE